MTDESWRSQHLIFERMVRAMMGCPVPLVAAVNGAAYGGGCEIAAASDFVYAASTARFALTEATLGIMPGGGRYPEFGPRRRRASRQGVDSVGPPVHRARGGSMGACQSGRPNLPSFWRPPSESPTALPPTARSRSVKPSKRFIAACRCRCGTASPSRSKLTIAWSRPTTAAKACSRSMSAESRCFGGR